MRANVPRSPFPDQADRQRRGVPARPTALPTAVLDSALSPVR